MDVQHSLKTTVLVMISMGVGLTMAYLFASSGSAQDEHSEERRKYSGMRRLSRKSNRKRRLLSSEYSDDLHSDCSDSGIHTPRPRSPASTSPPPRRWQGFSLNEAKAHQSIGAEKANAMSPAGVLDELQRGNARFWMGASARPQTNAIHRRALLNGQYPTVCVLGCSDSRVPVEIVFDQGLGDIFVIRVAGNLLEETTTASLEYAVGILKVKVVVIMGHEECGAIKAAQSVKPEEFGEETTALQRMLTTIKSGLDIDRLCHIHDGRARDREAVITNVRHQLVNLRKESLVKSKLESGDLLVTGAFYEISSGIVDFFSEEAHRS